MENKIICDYCGKTKKRIVKNVNICNECYRKKLEEYSFYDYKVDKKHLRGNALKICEMLIEEGFERKEIHKILGLNKIYVSQIIKKYTIRVNMYGEKRPF